MNFTRKTKTEKNFSKFFPSSLLNSIEIDANFTITVACWATSKFTVAITIIIFFSSCLRFFRILKMVILLLIKRRKKASILSIIRSKMSGKTYYYRSALNMAVCAIIKRYSEHVMNRPRAIMQLRKNNKRTIVKK